MKEVHFYYVSLMFSKNMNKAAPLKDKKYTKTTHSCPGIVK